jgi:hypothetical protein
MERIYGGEAEPGTSSDGSGVALSGERDPRPLTSHRGPRCGVAALVAALSAADLAAQDARQARAVMAATATVVESSPAAAPTALRVGRTLRAREGAGVEVEVTIGAARGAAYRVTALAPPAASGDGSRRARVLVAAPDGSFHPLGAAPAVVLDAGSATRAGELRLRVEHLDGAPNAASPIPLVVEVATQRGDVFTTYRLTALLGSRATTAAGGPPHPPAPIAAR